MAPNGPRARHFPASFVDGARIEVHVDGRAILRNGDEPLFDCDTLDALLAAVQLTFDDLVLVMGEVADAG